MRVFNYTENQMVLLNPLAPSETNKQRDTYTHIRRRWKVKDIYEY